jgi:hypothetical protein
VVELRLTPLTGTVTVTAQVAVIPPSAVVTVKDEECDEREMGGDSGPGVLVYGRGLIGHFSLLQITVYQ